MTTVESRNTAWIRRNFNICFMLCFEFAITRIGFVRRFFSDSYVVVAPDNPFIAPLITSFRPFLSRVFTHTPSHESQLDHCDRQAARERAFNAPLLASRWGSQLQQSKT